jgi:hypothetical protein
MKISSLHHKIKVTWPAILVAWAGLAAILLGAGCAAILLGAGCAAPLAEATFPVRPDTVEPGDIAGPFEGRVVDAATGHPIAFALVQASWALEVGRGLTAPAGAVTTTAATDSDGRYQIDRLRAFPGRRTRVERVTVTIYKRGYVAYRSDRRFDDLGVRHDFAQTGVLIKLDRYPAGLSHVKHIRFVGGAGALRAALSGEYVQASLELAGRAVPAEPATTGPLLDASALLSEDELRAVTGYEGRFIVEKLADLPTTANYDSKHFRAEGKPESFDAAIRVWKLGSAQAAEARFATLKKEVPHAEIRDELGDASLRGWDGKILAAATMERARGLVIELTCGVELCRDAEQAVALLKRVLSRGERLGEKAAPTPPAEAAPAETAPAEEKPPEEKPPEEEKPFQLRQPELHR